MIENKNRLIGICGGSCSGKSSITELLEQLRPTDTYVSFDDYFLGVEALTGQTIADWESPSLCRLDEYLNDLKQLKRGDPVRIMANSRKSSGQGIRERFIIPSKYIFVEGFLIYYLTEAAQMFD